MRFLVSAYNCAMVGTTWVFWAVWGTAGVFIVAGIVLLYLGLFHDRSRGRRRCPRCRYDLSGTPKIMTCSECGFTAQRANDFYRTWRSWRMASVGVLCLLIGLAPAGWHYWQKIDTIRYAPVWVLERNAVALDSDGVLARRELLRRAQNDAISNRRVRLLVERILNWQADPDFPWHDPVNGRATLGDIIEAADDRGLVTDEQFEQYIRQAFDGPINIEVRERMRAADQFSYRIWQDRPRLSSRFMTGRAERPSLGVYGQMINVDGCVVPDRFVHPIHPLANTWSQSFGSSSLACELTPGAHEITFKFDLALRDVDPDDRWRPLDHSIRSIDGLNHVRHRWQREVAASFIVVEDDEEIIERIENSGVESRIRHRIEVRLGVEEISINGIRQQLAPHWAGAVVMREVLVPVAFDVIGRAGNREVVLTSLVTTHWPSRSPVITPIPQSAFAQLQPEDEKIDIILRTNIRMAEMQLDLDSVWSGEIIFEDVPLQYEATLPNE